MRLLCVVFALGLSEQAVAQVPKPAVPTQVEILVLPAAGDSATVGPVATQVTDIGPALNCNHPVLPDAAVPLVNPTITQMEDPFTAGRFCRAPVPIGLPDGDYRAVAVFVAPTCEVNGVPTSPCRSARSLVGVPPFAISGPLGPPPVPMGVKVSK